jgi:hypothetical protein
VGRWVRPCPCQVREWLKSTFASQFKMLFDMLQCLQLIKNMKHAYKLYVKKLTPKGKITCDVRLCTQTYWNQTFILPYYHCYLVQLVSLQTSPSFRIQIFDWLDVFNHLLHLKFLTAQPVIPSFSCRTIAMHVSPHAGGFQHYIFRSVLTRSSHTHTHTHTHTCVFVICAYNNPTPYK